jgi:hypothetical protein
MDGTPNVDLTSLTIVLLALVGVAMVGIGLWLLAIGRISLSGETTEHAVEAGISNLVTFKTRIPSLGLMILGIVSILGASQLAHQARMADIAREERQRFVIVGQVRAADLASLSGVRLTLMTRYVDLLPLDDGSVWGNAWAGSRRYELRIRSAGRTKPEAVVGIERAPTDGRLTLPEIDLDELLGRVVIERPAPAPTPSEPLPNRTATPSFGSAQP